VDSRVAPAALAMCAPAAAVAILALQQAH